MNKGLCSNLVPISKKSTRINYQPHVKGYRDKSESICK